jgi:simple sugar transport system permease protein
MQRVVQVPSALVTALNGLVVVFVVSSEIWRRRRQRRRMIVAEEEDGAELPNSSGEVEPSREEEVAA